ncbi:MAG: GtrA family protein [Rubritepida sp.]|jgi:putative flippase GtrA|nr:GtrA family protein [Rubritepida sp.]MCU0946143.1 GtrA family protein [Rubritepida sp.]
MKDMIGQFLRFGVVGTIGFVVDTATLLTAVWLGAGPYGGRVISYIVAATTTWALNRTWTFRARATAAPVARQWALFLLLNLAGFAANYGTYVLVTSWLGTEPRQLVIGVAAGALAGMFINFTLARQVIFRPAQ